MYNVYSMFFFLSEFQMRTESIGRSPEDTRQISNRFQIDSSE